MPDPDQSGPTTTRGHCPRSPMPPEDTAKLPSRTSWRHASAPQPATSMPPTRWREPSSCRPTFLTSVPPCSRNTPIRRGKTGAVVPSPLSPPIRVLRTACEVLASSLGSSGRKTPAQGIKDQVLGVNYGRLIYGDLFDFLLGHVFGGQIGRAS